ncbi:MAG: carotenoid biosynthesis protein, partial [Thermoanaerobaculia bacterium]|nr:carotenoid biosynthesis protein [Thermoanaerobaculia bacterium]
LLGAMALGARWGGAKASMTAAVPAFVAFDLVIDPGAVALGLWSWEGSGPYYGVPVGNLAGWAVTGISGILIVALALGRQRDRLESVPVEVALSALLHVLFFSAVCFAHDRFFPGLLGLAIVAGSGIASFTVSAAQPAALVQPGGQRCEQDERR